MSGPNEPACGSRGYDLPERTRRVSKWPWPMTRQCLCKIGGTHFEMFGAVESSLDDLAEILRAVFTGEIEESGSRSDAFARIGAGPRPWHVGAVSLPIPWRLRHRIRRYAAYS